MTGFRVQGSGFRKSTPVPSWTHEGKLEYAPCFAKALTVLVDG